LLKKCNHQTGEMAEGKIINNRYRYLETLGYGGFGGVLKVESIDTGRIYALKYLTRTQSSPFKTAAELSVEFLSLRALDHPNVVRVIEFNVDENLGEYMVMEYIDGIEIGEYFHRNHNNPEILFNLLVQLLSALSYIHQAGIIHGDLKPENILVMDTGSSDKQQSCIKITDFGLLTLLNEDQDLFNNENFIRGSIPFIAPEILLGGNPDIRVDIYSLGVTLYYLISGSYPFTGTTVHQMLLNILETSPDFSDIEKAGYQKSFIRLLKKMLHREPVLRPSSVIEISDIVGSLINNPDLVDKLPNSQSINLYSPPLVGRKTLLRKTRKLIRDLKKGKASNTIFYGKKGFGKSRLLHEIKTFVTVEGMSCFSFNISQKTVNAYLIKSLTDTDFFSKNWESKKSFEEFSKNSSVFFEKLLIKFFDEENRDPAIFWDSRKVLLIDNVQRLDFLSIQFLKYLASDFNGNSLLIVCTIDPDEEFSHVDEFIHTLKNTPHKNFSSSDIPELSEQQTSSMISSVLGNGEVSSVLLTSIYKSVHGIPAHIHELLTYLVDNKALLRDGGQITLKEDLLEGNLPESIHDLFKIRWDSLNKENQVLMSMFAMIRVPCPSNIIISYARNNQKNVSAQLNELLRRGFINKVSTGSIPFLEISNELFRDFALGAGYALDKRTFYSGFSALLLSQWESNRSTILCPLIAQCLNDLGQGNKSIPFLLESGNYFTEHEYYDTAAEEYHLGLTYSLDLKDHEKSLVFANKLGSILDKTMHNESVLVFLEEKLRKVFLAINNPVHFSRIQNLVLTISQMLELKGRYADSYDLLLSGLRLTGRHTSPQVWFRYLIQAGWLLERTRTYKVGSNDPDSMIEVLTRIAVIYERLGKLENAKQIFVSGLTYFKNSKKENHLARCNGNLGLILYRLGQYEDSIYHFNEALKLASKLKDPTFIANAENNIGWSYFTLGNWRKAEKHFQKSLELKKKIGNKIKIAATILNLGTVAMKQAKYATAEKHFNNSLKIATNFNNTRLIAQSLRRLGVLNINMENFPEAIQQIKKGLRFSKKNNDKYGLAMSNLNIAEALYHMGNFRKALDNAQSAYRLFHEISSNIGCISSLNISAMISLDTQNFDNMNSYIFQIEQLLEKTPNRWEEAKYKKIKACFIACEELYDVSHKMFEESFKILRNLNDIRELGYGYFDLVKYLHNHIPYDTWKRYLNWAEEIFTDLKHDTTLKKIAVFKSNLVSNNDTTAYSTHASFQDQIGMIHKISTILASFSNLKKLINKCLKSAVELFQADRGALLMYDSDKNRLELSASIAIDRSSLQEIKRISYSVVENVISNSNALFTNNAIEDERFKDRKSIITHNILSILCVPLVAKSRTIGALYLDSLAQKNLFRTEDIRLMEIFASMVSLAIENAQKFRQLKIDKKVLTREIKQQHRISEEIIGTSPELKKVFEILDKLKYSDVTVLIEGESGTGKELVARYLHYDGKRYLKPFVILDCSGLPQNLAESALFGHGKGAFTGAISSRTGLLESADKGTLFIDELPDLQTETQKKLLRFFEEQSFRPLGSDKDIKVNVRIIAATNKNLEEKVKLGEFRQDLFYRLNVIKIKLPPLRNRKDDIPLLINHFFLKKGYIPGSIKIAKDSMELLKNYPWPGNIRQLKNEIDRICSLYNPKTVQPEHLSDIIHYHSTVTEFSGTQTIKDSIKFIEKQLISKTLKKFNGNRSQTARVLGISRPTLINKIKQFRIK